MLGAVHRTLFASATQTTLRSTASVAHGGVIVGAVSQSVKQDVRDAYLHIQRNMSFLSKLPHRDAQVNNS